MQGVVMIVLTVFGYGSYRIWLFGGPFFNKTLLSLLFYSISLVLEWLKIAFGPTQLDYAAVYSSIILVFVVITGVLFFLIDKQAGLMCIPYVCWLGFSTVLFYSLWMLNSDGDWFANRENILSNINMKNKMLRS